ncbi:hypothetical protein JW968_02365 [Candidatus Woesearchaeota archaeon]|nr:hypothetical protein [Candidatus Woesearchaeota archaeon]
MEEPKIINNLEDFGLTEKETRVYLANLKIGTSKVNEIAKKANILRETTYAVLRSLIEKGLVSHVIKSGIKYFEAVDPSELINILEEKKTKIESILPDLIDMKMSVMEKPEITVYEGKTGLKTILDMIIKDKPRELLQLSSADILETLQFYFPHWIKKRIENKIKTRILNQKTAKMIYYKRTGKEALREVRFLPANFKITTSNFIYNNKIAIMTMKADNIIGVMIENKDIVDTEKSQFEFIWKNSKAQK